MKEIKKRKIYTKPEVIHEIFLETRAGSVPDLPGNDPFKISDEWVFSLKIYDLQIEKHMMIKCVQIRLNINLLLREFGYNMQNSYNVDFLRSLDQTLWVDRI